MFRQALKRRGMGIQLKNMRNKMKAAKQKGDAPEMHAFSNDFPVHGYCPDRSIPATIFPFL